MKKWLAASITFILIAFTLNTFACGPTPQKVVKEITIKADTKTVWEIIDRFDAIALWHPDVQSSVLVQKIDEEGNPATHRLI